MTSLGSGVYDPSQKAGPVLLARFETRGGSRTEAAGRGVSVGMHFHSMHVDVEMSWPLALPRSGSPGAGTLRFDPPCRHRK